MTGYDVRAKVRSSGDEHPVSGVELQLYSYDKSNRGGLGSHIAKARSDDGGRVVFASVPQGCFVLVPSFAEQTTQFEFNPASLQVEVQHGSVVIEKPFEVVGFTVYGRVLLEDGRPVQGVKVSVNGERAVETDGDGFYKIDKMKAGIYDVIAEKDNYEFKSLRNIQIAANSADLPDIIVRGIDVCGTISIPHYPSTIVPPGQRIVRVEGNGIKRVEQTKSYEKKKGVYRFCFQLAPSNEDYIVTASLTPEEEAAGLLLSSSSLPVNVANGPVLWLSFSQSLPNVSGKVQCIAANCAKGLSVRLNSRGKTVYTTKVEDTGKFLLTNVFSGTYEAVIQEPLGLVSPWCWKSPSFEISVASTDLDTLSFEQVGYKLEVRSPGMHVPLNVTARSTKGKMEPVSYNFDGLDKSVDVCVPAAGKYSISVSSCVVFDEYEFIYDTAVYKSSAINLRASFLRLNGEIDVHSSAGMDLKALISDKDGKEVLAKVSLVTFDNSVPLRVYNYNHLLPVGVEQNLKISVTPGNSEYLVYPPVLSYKYTPQNVIQCLPSPRSIAVKLGGFVIGKVTPEVKGVKIDVKRKSSEDVILSGETDGQGFYKLGPLHDLDNIEVFIFVVIAAAAAAVVELALSYILYV